MRLLLRFSHAGQEQSDWPLQMQNMTEILLSRRSIFVVSNPNLKGGPWLTVLEVGMASTDAIDSAQLKYRCTG